MRKINFNKNKCFLALVCVLCLTMVAPVFADMIAREHFARSVGVRVGDLGNLYGPAGSPGFTGLWDGSNDFWMVGADSLVYTDANNVTAASAGGKLLSSIRNAGADIRQNIAGYRSPVIAGAVDGEPGREPVFYSFLMECTTLPIDPPDDHYIFYIRGSKTGSTNNNTGGDLSNYCRLSVRSITGTQTYELGIYPGDNNGNAQTTYPDEMVPPKAQYPMDLNKTYMIVIKYEFIVGDDNDIAHFWINPLLDQTVEPEPLVSKTATGHNELLDSARDAYISYACSFRDQDPKTTSDTGVINYDDARMGTSWADVTSSRLADPRPDFSPNANLFDPPVNGQVYGTFNSVSVRFDVPMAGITAAAMDVNGTKATAVRTRNFNQNEFLFTGDFGLTPGTTVTMTLDPSGITDAVLLNPLTETVAWQCEYLPMPAGAIVTQHFHVPAGENLQGFPTIYGADNNTNEHEVLAGSLTYAGLDNLSVGNKVFMKNIVTGASGDDAIYMRSAPDGPQVRVVGEGQTAYASFLLNPKTIGDKEDYIVAFDTPDYINGTSGQLHGSNGMTNAATEYELTMRLNVQSGINAAGTTNNTKDGMFFLGAANALPLNATSLVVIKYTMVPGEDNDVFESFIFNDGLAPPTTEPATPTGSVTQGGTDPASLSKGIFKNRDVSPSAGIRGATIFPRGQDDAGSVEVDEIRFGTTWESVVNNPAINAATDTTVPPTVTEAYPEADQSYLGAVTHVQLRFSEDVLGVLPGVLTVNGSEATTFTRVGESGGLPLGDRGYFFTGFTPVTTGTATIAFNGATVLDVAGNATADLSYDVTIVGGPADGLLFYDGFDYTNDEKLVGFGGWVEGEALASEIKVAIDGNPSTANLTYPTLLPSTGGRVVLDRLVQRLQGGGDGQSQVRATWLLENPILGDLGETSLYYSFIVKPTGDAAIGNSFFADIQNVQADSWELGRTHTGPDNTPNHTFGARFINNVDLALEPGTGHAVGESVFIVGKLTPRQGPDNDTFELWVNPFLGLSERPGGLLSTVSAGSGDDVRPEMGLTAFELRSNISCGQVEVDEVRVGLTWESVTPATVIVIPKAGTSNWMLYEN